MELAVEHKVGATKGTPLEKDVEHNFSDETYEVGIYLAMARQAEREGYPEIASALRRIAEEEAFHASLYAELNAKISTSTKENIEKRLADELEANKEKRAIALKAKELNIDPAHDIFDETARDEGRHAQILQGLLRRYFK